MRSALVRSLPALLLAATLGAQDVADHDVVWRTPSRDASGSMPIGNGEVGCNVWCEPGGRLCFLVSRTDSLSEASRLLKLGRVVVTVRPTEPGEFFEQRLLLQEGCIRVTMGEGARRVVLRLFVDSEADVVHVAADSATPASVSVAIESWRGADRRLRGEELQSSWTMKDAPDDLAVTESADARVLRHDGGEVRIGVRHHNRTSVVAFTAARQGLPATAVVDPLLRRTFGLLATAPGAVVAATPSGPAAVLQLPPATRHELRVAAPCLQDDPQQWDARADELLRQGSGPAAAARTAQHWRRFWQRSWVFVRGDRAAGVPANRHPLRIGVDSAGGNRFVGRIARVELRDGPQADDLGHEAEGGPPRPALFTAAPGTSLPLVDEGCRDLDLAEGLCITATVAQDQAHPIGRIVDKLTAGTSDGFLFDTHPGRSLRLIVGARQLVAKDALQPGATHAVEARFHAATGRMQIACDGQVVADSAAGAAGAADPQPASRLTQALILQRWIQACGGRGQFPIKFNGSIFTVEPEFTGGQPHDADWRRWGDCFWWQNTRLPYHPMLAQGDFDMQAPLFRLYRSTLPLAEARARTWHAATGAYWPETMTPFGTHGNGDYGWQRDDLPAGKVLCPWWEYARNQGLELLALLLDRFDYERDPAFFAQQVLPIAGPVLDWFAATCPRTPAGTLRIAPTQALETHWHRVEDDMPTVAGLHWCLARLRTLAPELVPPAQLAAWRALAKALPPIPVREDDGVRLLAPAATYDPSRQNCESPELYAVFPFRLYGLGKPDLELARQAFRRRHDRFTDGWPQDGQDAALLGLADEARANVLGKVRNANPAHRFPVMWGPNFDWCPDQCHGSNLLDTVHRMLLQCDDGRILLLPCWPKDWDVSFKLWAPRRTLVECVYHNGRIERLEVTPADRRRDVVLPE